MSKKSEEICRAAVIIGTVLFFVAPIFRSGSRDELTGFEWLVNHTRWGPVCEYVPLEDYLAELKRLQ